ncbi:MAG: cysteine desulfurase [Clostridia bacterium]|nr:cysteine desulfurase [Clostridia bacterium]
MSEIYFDNSATTKMSKGARDKMLSVINESYGNPSSLHKKGLDSEHVIKEARDIILNSIGVMRGNKNELIFTSSGTEANNLAIFGTVFAKKRQGGEKILTTRGEHASVEEPLTYLEGLGYRILRVPTEGGKLDLDFIRQNARDVILCTFMHVNNETGATYDLKTAFDIVREQSPNAVFHADCVQSYLKTNLTVKGIGADLLTISAHKVNGAKGVGALYVRPEIIKAKKLVAVTLGGGQESNFRSGTENVYGISAFGEAVKEHTQCLKHELEKMSTVRAYLVDKLSQMNGVSLNLPEAPAPHILNIEVKGIRSETTLHYLSSKGIFVSSGSACSSNANKGHSRALVSFGLKPYQIDSAIRISLSPQNTIQEADMFLDVLAEAIKRLARR